MVKTKVTQNKVTKNKMSNKNEAVLSNIFMDTLEIYYNMHPDHTMIFPHLEMRDGKLVGKTIER